MASYQPKPEAKRDKVDIEKQSSEADEDASSQNKSSKGSDKSSKAAKTSVKKMGLSQTFNIPGIVKPTDKLESKIVSSSSNPDDIGGTSSQISSS